MHHSHGYPHEQTERNKSLLLVGKPIALKRERRPREHLGRINKIQAVGFQIGLSFGFIPLVLHLRSVYTQSDQRKGQKLPANAKLSGRPLTYPARRRR